ncbi:MAG: lysophospholipid acyltransferase family protein [Myxococcota bacterium]
MDNAGWRRSGLGPGGLRRAWRLLRVFTVLALYFSAAPFGYAAFALLRALPSRDRDARARKLQRVLQRAFTLMHDCIRAFRLIDFDPRRVEGELPEGPCVVVANHPSLIDVTSIMATVGGAATAVKPSIFRRWWLRPLLEDAGQFEGNGASPLSIARLVDASVDRLGRGFRVLLFPEGTRSPEGGLHRFGRAPFEVACQANVPVVPIVVTLEPRWLTKERGILRPPDGVSRQRLTVLKPIHPADYGRCSRTLRDVVDARIRERLGLVVPASAVLDENHEGITGIAPEEADRRIAHA